MTIPKHILLRAYLLFFAVVVVLLVVLVKTTMIINDGRENVFSSVSNKIQQRSALIEPRRGEILDANLSPLVTSVAYYDVYMDPTTVKKDVWDNNITGLSNGLAEVFPKKNAREWQEYLRKNRANKRRYVLIEKKVTNETRRALRALPIFNLGRFKGGIIDSEVIIERKRPHDELLKRTLGYIKLDGEKVNKIGIEGAFDEYLGGVPGEIIQQKISNSWKPTGTMIRESQDGYDLVTSIDKDIQEVAHTELENQLKIKGGRYGCAIVMDVKTGFVKAMVNLQEGSDGKYYESYNHAIGTREVPGSTFKLASLMALLEDEKVKLTDTVNAVGKYEFYGRYLNDSRSYGYGKITLKEAFEKSSNVISKVVFNNYKTQPERFIEKLEQFGLFDKTGFNLSGERTPYFSKPGSSEWWGGSLAWMSIGYEVQLTPLQLLSFYNAFANDGRYMRPQIVSHVKSGTKVIKEFKPEVVREQICSPSTIREMKGALEGVMLRGTGKYLNSIFFKTAGKTGTAQIANKNKGYGRENEKKYIASFAGYFPADDPIYSCIVVIAAPSDDIYGATVSGTVFSAIANKVYATSLSYHKAVNEKSEQYTVPHVFHGNRVDINTVLNFFKVDKKFNGSEDWVFASPQNNHVKILSKKTDKLYVPDVVGMGLKDAVFLIEQTGMHPRVNGYGKVVKQSLKPGTKAVPGGVIEIDLN